MMAIGGGSQFTTHCECECYSITDDAWYRVAQMSTPRARAGVLELDGFVYSTGGYDGACHLLSMEKYNPSVSRAGDGVITSHHNLILRVIRESALSGLPLVYWIRGRCSRNRSLIQVSDHDPYLNTLHLITIN